MHPRAAAVVERLPPGPRGLVTLAWRTAHDSFEDRVPGLAAEVAFYLILSVPPLLLTLLGVVRLVDESTQRDLVTELRFALSFVFSPETRDAVIDPLFDSLGDGSRGIATFGVIFTLWTASRALNVLISAITIAYDLEERRRRGWRRRLLAFGLTGVGVVGAGALIPLVAIGPRRGVLLLARLLGREEQTFGLLTGPVPHALYWVVVIVVATLLMSVLYHYGAPWKTPWRHDIPGAVLAMGIWLAGSGGLRLYTTASIESDAAYAGIGGTLALLVWFYVLGFGLLLGAELNAELEKSRLSLHHEAAEAGQEAARRSPHPAPPVESDRTFR